MKLLATQIACCVGTLLVGLATGYWLGRKSPDNQYVSTQEIALVGQKGEITGYVPIGTTLTSELALSRDADLGWWAYLPIYLGTTDEAKELLVSSKSSNRHAISADGTLNGRARSK